jgi:intein/homing endonuclease
MSDVMEFINEDGTFSAYDDTYDVVIHCETEEEQKKVIERLKATNWIPVSERLPEPGKDVAVLLKGFIPAIGRYEVIRDDIGAFVVPGQIETPVEFRLPVTAWTPLPDSRRDRKWQ